MKSFLCINEWTLDEYKELFEIAEYLEKKTDCHLLEDKMITLFFPETSVRTRMSFEIGIKKYGGKSINFPDTTLNKREKLEDVIGYISNWSDLVIIRNENIELLREIEMYSPIPIINAMTSQNHPCEIIHDIYALKKIFGNIGDLRVLYIGPKTNIGNSWYEAAKVFGFHLTQACPEGYEIGDRNDFFCVDRNIENIINRMDVIVTDTILKQDDYIERFRLNDRLFSKMKRDAVFNPTPPFYRDEVMDTSANWKAKFVGYQFKKSLLEVQVALIKCCLNK